MKKKYLIVIVGPTAVGKTSVGISIAQHFNTHVLSADSRQFYQQMEIGTAKPTLAERSAAPHHFVDTLDIETDYNAGQFEVDALALLAQLHQEKEVVLVVGGSGLYVNALCDGMDHMPKVDLSIRDKLNKEKEELGLEALLHRLVKQDPDYAKIVDKHNPQRIIRALEVIESSGKPYSSFRKQGKVSRPFEVIKVGLELPRALLYERIDLRMDLMIQAGLFEEAKKLYDLRHLNALQTVGYKEIFDYLEQKYDRDEAIRLLKRNSRRYAKRQMTWFKRDEAVSWFAPSPVSEIIKFLESQLDIENIH